MTAKKADDTSQPPADPPVVEPEATEESQTEEEREESVQDAILRRTQGLMDQSISQIKQGQFTKLNPKVTQLLAAYHQTLSPGEEAGNPAPQPAAPATAPATDAPVSEGDRGRIETSVIAGMWARDFKALCEELKGWDGMTNATFATIDITNTKKFPQTREGYMSWTQAANQLRLQATATQMVSHAREATQEDREEAAAVGADREKASKHKKPPQPTPAGRAITSVDQAAQLKKKGRLSGKEFLDIVRKETSPGVLD